MLCYPLDVAGRGQKLSHYPENGTNPDLQAQHSLQIPNRDSAISSYCFLKPIKESNHFSFVFRCYRDQVLPKVYLEAQVSCLGGGEFPLFSIQLYTKL